MQTFGRNKWRSTWRGYRFHSKPIHWKLQGHLKQEFGESVAKDYHLAAQQRVVRKELVVNYLILNCRYNVR